MDVNSDAVLAACPFCGGEAFGPNRRTQESGSVDVYYWLTVGCTGCGAETAVNAELGNAAVIARWNRRATPASDEAVGDAMVQAALRSYFTPDGVAAMTEEQYADELAGFRDLLTAALSARTAAPAEQGVSLADLRVTEATPLPVLQAGLAECEYRHGIAVGRDDADAAAYWGPRAKAFDRELRARLAPIALTQHTPLHQFPIAPDARSVEADVAALYPELTPEEQALMVRQNRIVNSTPTPLARSVEWPELPKPYAWVDKRGEMQHANGSDRIPPMDGWEPVYWAADVKAFLADCQKAAATPLARSVDGLSGEES